MSGTNVRTRRRLRADAEEHGWTVTVDSDGTRPTYAGGRKPAPRVTWARFTAEKTCAAGIVRLSVFFDRGRFTSALVGRVDSARCGILNLAGDVFTVLEDPACGFVPAETR